MSKNEELCSRIEFESKTREDQNGCIMEIFQVVNSKIDQNSKSFSPHQIEQIQKIIKGNVDIVQGFCVCLNNMCV